jgi:hypothetical protein
VAAAGWMTGVSVAADAAATEEEAADIVLSVDAQVWWDAMQCDMRAMASLSCVRHRSTTERVS